MAKNDLKTLKISLECHKKLSIVKTSLGLKTLSDTVDTLINFYHDEKDHPRQNSRDNQANEDTHSNDYGLFPEEDTTLIFGKSSDEVKNFIWEHENVFATFSLSDSENRHMIIQNLKQVSNEFDDVKFLVIIKSPETQGLFLNYDIKEFPTFIIFKKNSDRARFQGVLSYKEIRNIIRTHIRSND